MMLKRIVLAVGLCTACALSTASMATSYSTDQSDVWYNPSESGWGFQLVQRGSVIFATMYVYGPDNAPVWYTALMYSSGTMIWEGDLYLTHGPWFGTVPFDPGLVTYRKVGTMTWIPQSVDSGLISYTVDGVGVVKNVVREELVLDDFSGTYMGGLHERATACTDPSLDQTTESSGLLQITQSGESIQMQSIGADGTIECVYSGTLTQAGQMGGITGSFTCAGGSNGTLAASEMQVTPSGITGRFHKAYSNPPGCQGDGWFGGMRSTLH
ncbi:MAG TPA: hypothetical protein VFR41_12215 [Acidimicrobiia bacterium]|nr:hypothetical protein [Acidimicrobiia bacterium]